MSIEDITWKNYFGSYGDTEIKGFDRFSGGDISLGTVEELYEAFQLRQRAESEARYQEAKASLLEKNSG